MKWRSTINACVIICAQFYCQTIIGDDTHSGIDLASRGCLIQLNMSDTIQFYQFNYEVGNYYVYTDTSYGQTSIRGFLYTPSHGNPVAWSVYNSDGISGSGTSLLFPGVLVNAGSPSLPWQPNNNQVLVDIAFLFTQIDRIQYEFIRVVNFFIILNDLFNLI